MKAVRIRDSTYNRLLEKQLEILKEIDIRVDLQNLASDSLEIGLPLVKYRDHKNRIEA